MRKFRFFLLSAVLPTLSLVAQERFSYLGVNVTGQLTQTATENASTLAQGQSTQSGTQVESRPLLHASPPIGELIRIDSADDARVGGLPVRISLGDANSGEPIRRPRVSESPRIAPRLSSLLPDLQGLPVNPTSSSFGFLGMTSLDQRNANSGNQLNVEPPSQGLAVGNGFVVEGVNNALQIYNTSGQPLLNSVLATNQLFGLSPALNRTTGQYGVFPTDIRAFYDQTLNRFIILQRAQDVNPFGNRLASSHLYIAVSQTGDPTQSYNVYSMNTTNTLNFGCPCVADYPQIGADQYGIYISWNEYDSTATYFRDAIVLAIDKASLASNAPAPTAVKFTIPHITGYEFTIQPAVTPPGGNYFLGNGGVEYFVSAQIFSFPDSNVGVWGVSNTSSLATSSPSLLLQQVVVPALSYSTPPDAFQRPGPLPLGSSIGEGLKTLDGGDTRVQSVEYVAGRLYLTIPTTLQDDNNATVVGAVYVILSPVFRGPNVNASVAAQGYLYVNSDSVLRTAMCVNAQGQGAIIFTLAGPDYYPSAAFVTVNNLSIGSTVQIAAAGASPEDGFSGYLTYGGNGLFARWGDYSAAVANSDGSIWMATEYIPNAPRSQLANWGTYIMRFQP